MRFLSERNIEMHREYLNGLILKYRIFEKSYPELSGCNIDGIYKAKIPFSERIEAANLYSEILAHKTYFSSFGNRNSKSERIKNEFGSVAQFLYEIREHSKHSEHGFLLIYDDKGKLGIYCGAQYEKILRFKKVLLALDLCEHAYFYDYGFKKDEYVLSAISHFDLNKV